MTPVYRAAAQIEIGDPSDDALSQNHTRQEENARGLFTFRQQN